MTFHEVLSKSALNRVPGASRMPFSWTINPYRGCSHACVYCFARGTHEYLDLDGGADFDSQIVVKVNVVEVLERELRRASWQHETVALGTNTDPYQRAEGRYRLMPGIIETLAASGTPFSVLTKGTLIRRDIPLLVRASQRVPVDIQMSIAMYDDELQKAIEPGTPGTQARLDTVRALTGAGFRAPGREAVVHEMAGRVPAGSGVVVPRALSRSGIRRPQGVSAVARQAGAPAHPRARTGRPA